MTPAPLAVDAAALLVSLTEACRAWPDRGARFIGDPLVAAARQVAVDAALAVAHRDARADALRRVDHGLVALRVLINAASTVDESFSQPLLEYPQYTRPREYDGVEVPDVLLSGHHAAIERWRHDQAVARTRAVRPDLLADGSQDR